MLFSSNFDRWKVNPLTYIKFWSQTCLPTLLHGMELFTLTPTLLTKFDRCQQWFLKNVFYVPKFAPCQLLLKLSGLWSIDSEIGLRKLLFLGRLLTGNKMAPVVCTNLPKPAWILCLLRCSGLSLISTLI